MISGRGSSWQFGGGLDVQHIPLLCCGEVWVTAGGGCRSPGGVLLVRKPLQQAPRPMPPIGVLPPGVINLGFYQRMGSQQLPTGGDTERGPRPKNPARGAPGWVLRSPPATSRPPPALWPQGRVRAALCHNQTLLRIWDRARSVGGHPVCHPPHPRCPGSGGSGERQRAPRLTGRPDKSL